MAEDFLLSLGLFDGLFGRLIKRGRKCKEQQEDDRFIGEMSYLRRSGSLGSLSRFWVFHCFFTSKLQVSRSCFGFNKLVNKNMILVEPEPQDSHDFFSLFSLVAEPARHTNSPTHHTPHNCTAPQRLPHQPKLWVIIARFKFSVFTTSQVHDDDQNTRDFANETEVDKKNLLESQSYAIQLKYLLVFVTSKVQSCRT